MDRVGVMTGVGQWWWLVVKVFEGALSHGCIPHVLGATRTRNWLEQL